MGVAAVVSVGEGELDGVAVLVGAELAEGEMNSLGVIEPGVLVLDAWPPESLWQAVAVTNAIPMQTTRLTLIRIVIPDPFGRWLGEARLGYNIFARKNTMVARSQTSRMLRSEYGP